MFTSPDLHPDTTTRKLRAISKILVRRRTSGFRDSLKDVLALMGRADRALQVLPFYCYCY